MAHTSPRKCRSAAQTSLHKFTQSQVGSNPTSSLDATTADALTPETTNFDETYDTLFQKQ